MTNDQAFKKALKLFGPRATVRNAGHFSSPERRAAASDLLRESRETVAAIDAEIARRLSELDWYQELLARRKAASELKSKAIGEAMFYRFSVGKLEMGFNLIKGQGDTWEEAFQKATEK